MGTRERTTGKPAPAILQYFRRTRGLESVPQFPPMRLIHLPFAISLSVLSLTLPASSLAQEAPMAIGEWRAALPFHTGLAVARADSMIFFATQHGMVRIDPSDGSPRFYSRIDGLSETGIARMAWSGRYRTLVLGYASGTIDLLNEAGALTLRDIADNLSITGDKAIYHITLAGDSVAVLSCGFGIVELDLGTRLFRRTAFTGEKVLQTTLHEGAWHAATASGIYRLAPGGFFQNFLAWERLGIPDGLPDEYKASGVVSTGGKLYAGIDDTLVTLSGGVAQPLYQLPGHRLRWLSADDGGLVAGFLPTNGGAGTLYLQEPGQPARTLTGECIGRPRDAVSDAAGNLWIADEWLDFRMIGPGGNCERQRFNSPFGSTSSEIRILGDSVYIAGGAVASNGSGLGNGSGIYVNRDGAWTNYNFFEYPEMQAAEAHVDLNTVIADPRDGTVFAGSYYGGLLEFRGGQLANVFQDNNSALKGAVGDEQRERVGGLVRDRNGHFWIANTLSPDPLVLLTADRQWKAFRPATNTALLKGLVDSQNNKWFVLQSGGILVYHEGANLLDPSDDKVRIFDAASGNLPSARAVSVAEDLDGAIWVGTDDGVGVIRCGDVFNTAQCRASRIVVTQDGILEALLNDEEIRAIAIDGANRKWLGTRNGLFAQSADGQTEVARFTAENSPLPDKQINALAFDPADGKLWIGTEKGVMVYQTDAPAGGEVHAETVTVYPNPVAPDYDGPIAIKGLPRDANVKITDVRGRLVHESTALGGQAIWDGLDYTGRRAASGVYLVFTSSEPNGFGTPDKAVAKIVLIR